MHAPDFDGRQYQKVKFERFCQLVTAIVLGVAIVAAWIIW